MNNPIFTQEQWSVWLDTLALKDYVVIDDFLPSDTLKAVLLFFEEQKEIGRLSPAKVGSAQNESRVAEIRTGFNFWIDKERDVQIKSFFDIADEIIQNIAQNLFLSLQGFEFHLAEYPTGGFYKPHIDQFDNRSNRMITLVLYLNPDWTNSDGGELKIHGENSILVEPIMNRVILFRSDVVLHEVVLSNNERRSLTGWFLKKPSNVGVLGW